MSHFRSLSREELAETGDRAGFLANGSLPDISPSPHLHDASGGHLLVASAEESGFPITVAGPRGNYTHFPFTPNWGTSIVFQRSKSDFTYTINFWHLSKKSSLQSAVDSSQLSESVQIRGYVC